MDKSPMTITGAQMLRDELHRLKTQERPRIIKAISEARQHGDLRENAEYHAAREQQSFTEGRIAEIEGKLATANIIDVRTFENDGKVIFGATVLLLNVGSGDEMSYRLVGEDEADIKSGLLSIKSPIARAIVGKQEGDTVSVETPGGLVEYEILDVRYI